MNEVDEAAREETRSGEREGRILGRGCGSKWLRTGRKNDWVGVEEEGAVRRNEGKVSRRRMKMWTEGPR